MDRFGILCFMRIGIDARLNFYRPGGIAEYTRHVIQHLAELDHAADYFVLHNFRDPNALTPAPNFTRINTYTPCHHRWERWALTAELLPRRLDILHSPDMIAPQRGGRHSVLTIMDLHFLHYAQFMTADSLRYYKGQIGRSVRQAAHILAISQATADDLVNLLDVPAEKITVNLLATNETFKPLPVEDINATRQRLNLPDSYILFVGTFEPRKNIIGLLDAYALLRADWPDAPPLVLAGRRGWLYDDIFAKVDDLQLREHIIWLENPSGADLPVIYNAAQVFVLPSFYEGFGLPALEAMACGTPAIVSNCSSLPEVVGDAGLLIDPDDPAQLADAIRRVLVDSDLYRHLRMAGLTRAATFTWRKTAETVLQTYHQVLNS